MTYLWSVTMRLLMYGSAVFYKTDGFSPEMMLVFRCNPVYNYITFIRTIVIDNTVPEAWDFGLLALFAFLVFIIGGFLYKRLNTEFLYYV